MVDCPGGTDEDFETCGYPQGLEKSIKPWMDDYSQTYHFARNQAGNGSKPSDIGAPKVDGRNDPKGIFLVCRIAIQQIFSTKTIQLCLKLQHRIMIVRF